MENLIDLMERINPATLVFTIAGMVIFSKETICRSSLPQWSVGYHEKQNYLTITSLPYGTDKD